METTKQYARPDQFEGRLPLTQAIPLGLQHVLAMFVGNLTPILIITNLCAAMGGAEEFAAIQVSLLQNAMLVAGIVTLVQLYAVGPIGGKVPIIMGTSSGFIGVFQSVVNVMGGGIVAIWLKEEVKGLPRRAADYKLCNNTRVITIATSLGEPNTLIQVENDDMLRLAVGLESADDLIEDLRRALEAV